MPRHPARRRHRFLRVAVAVAVATVVLVVAAAAFAYAWSSVVVTNVDTVSFGRPLAIPPLAPSRVDADGVRRFDLRVAPGETELLPGTRTATWGVNGPYLGPTLRAQRGERVAVDVHNDLPETTTMHWHGMKLPAVADGGPHSPIAPGTTWSPSWRVDQPSATTWYHPHPHGETARHVYRGVKGLFLVDDAEAALPNRYGVDDIPVVLEDKLIGDDGTLQEEANTSVGLLGDTMLVNGTWGPVLDVRTTTVRLRVLNASTARPYNLALPDDREFTVVGSDVGLLDAPFRSDRLLLAPGDRAEILVDLRAGESSMLRSAPIDEPAGGFEARLEGGDDSFDLLALRAAPTLEPVAAPPQRLPAAAPIVPPEGARVRDFVLDGNSLINNREMDMARIDEVVPLGATEVWRVRARGGIPHNIHVHNAAFEVLDVGGAPPPPSLRGPQDTIVLPQDTWVSLAMSFGPYPDPTTPFMIHCHLLDHEDRGMMAQFVIVR